MESDREVVPASPDQTRSFPARELSVIARRRAYQNQLPEHPGRLKGGQNADHCTDGMPDKHSVLQAQFTANFDEVLGIARKRRILSMVLGRKVGASSPDVVEKHHFEIVFEFGRHEAPHILIAPEAVGKNHSTVAVTTHVDVVFCQGAQ